MDFKQEQTQAQTQICCWPQRSVSPFLLLQGDGYSDPRWLLGELSPVWGDRVEEALARC